MAIFEESPNFENLLDSVNVIDESLFIESLGSVANQVKLGDTNTAVPGRLLGRVEAYEEAGASEYIKETVKWGYKLVFIDKKLPPSSYRQNNRSALSNPEFTYKELLRLESLGCTKRVNSKPHIVNPVSVVYSKKWRCVLDASLHLNPLCVKRKTRLADLSCIPLILREGDYMTVNDLDSGYWQVPIHPDHQQFLGLHFIHPDGSVDYWVWVVMPLGITDAAHIFTSITDPLMSHLQLAGARSSIYIDDLLSLSETFEKGLAQDLFIQNFFLKGGWVFKPSKSSGVPSQRVKYLGLIINSVSMKFEIPEDKLSNLIEKAKTLLSKRRVQVKQLASWVGLLQSCSLAVGPVVNIMCRSLYDDIKRAHTWFSTIELSDLAKFQLKWWIENLPSLSEYPICKDSTIVGFEFSIASDASDRGFFAYKVASKQRVFSRPFSVAESEESSTFKELTAIHETWTREDVLIEFSGQTVGHYTDNKGCVFILGGGSRQLKLQALALAIFLSLRRHGITLIPVWVSRENEIISWADLGSRDFRSDDYSLDSVTFASLESTYGKFTVDAMASSANATCAKFFSRYSSPGTSGVNFFAQILSLKENYYVFPPVRKAVDAIFHLAKFKCSGILIIPVWPRSWIFSFIFPDGTHCAGWVKTLELISPVFISGPRVGPVFKGQKSYLTAAIQFDFKQFSLTKIPVLNQHFCLKSGCTRCV